MSGRHRRISTQSQKFAVVGVATATATALTVGAAAPTPKPAPAPIVVHKDVDLAAAFRPFTDPSQIPDLTGGLGTAAYNVSQQIADSLLRLLSRLLRQHRRLRLHHRRYQKPRHYSPNLCLHN